MMVKTECPSKEFGMVFFTVAFNIISQLYIYTFN